MAQNVIPENEEDLSLIQLCNEYVLTRIRTSYGIDVNEMKTRFGLDLEAIKNEEINSLLQKGHMIREDDIYRLTFKGFMIADEITLKLFFEE